MAERAAELIQLLTEARRSMLSALEGVDKNAEVFPGWPVKNFLAHLAGWDEATVTALRAHREGRYYEIPAFRGIDDYNGRSVETRRDLSYEQVYAEWELVRRNLIEALKDMPPEKMEERFLLPWGRRGTVAALVKVMIDHEVEHCQDVLKIKGA
jgi:hypothetical protein